MSCFKNLVLNYRGIIHAGITTFGEGARELGKQAQVNKDFGFKKRRMLYG